MPTVWLGLLQHLRASGERLHTVRRLIIGGSACPPALIEAFDREYGVTVEHAWGMTETSPLGAVAIPPAGTPREQEIDYEVKAGRVVAGVEVRVVDDTGEVMPRDGKAIGEFEIRGPWIAGAYYGVDAPERFHDGWLKTGDIGTLDAEGFMVISDRSKDVIKSGGEWISSVELESRVMAHPAVFEAAVIAVPDERWDERPLCCVVLRPDATASAEELHDFLAPQVPKWWLPEHWTFLESIPKTSVGKFDKKVLRAQFALGEFSVTTLS